MRHAWLLPLVLAFASCHLAVGLGELDFIEDGAGGSGAGGVGGAGASSGAGGAGAFGGGSVGGGPAGGGGAGGMEPTCTEEPTLCAGSASVCHDGACVECAPGEDAACAGETPYCNPGTLACEACSYHAHCPDSACNVFTGACLNATPATIGPSGDYSTVQAALASVGAGEDGVFLISPNSGGSPYLYSFGLPLANMTVALLGVNGRARLSANNTGLPLPMLEVTDSATLLLEGVDLRGYSSGGRAMSVAGRVSLDRVEMVQNSGGGIRTTATAEVLVRNSIIDAGSGNEDALEVGNAKVSVLYSTIGGGLSSPAISCVGGELTVRNSILFNLNPGAVLDGCAGAMISRSAGREDLGGVNNTIFTVTAGIFLSLTGSGSDLRLTAIGRTLFDGVASWQAGDPPTDIDGTPRPSVDGTADVAGAHLGP